MNYRIALYEPESVECNDGNGWKPAACLFSRAEAVKFILLKKTEGHEIFLSEEEIVISLNFLKEKLKEIENDILLLNRALSNG